jgi:SAM domain (Sterile alpha motif)
MDVAVWLRGLGLQQYEALFRENDVDAEVLSDLTDGDLEKIGVFLGHRKRLLKAVAALAGPAAAPPAAATPIPPVADAAERRQPVEVSKSAHTIQASVALPKTL